HASSRETLAEQCLPNALAPQDRTGSPPAALDSPDASVGKPSSSTGLTVYCQFHFSKSSSSHSKNEKLDMATKNEVSTS
uniref:hypothetical protein n=1 Tax=Brasilonema bromeliae TaxID=383615 RepID=UPI00145DE387